MSLWLAMSGVLWSVVDMPRGTAIAPVTPKNGNSLPFFEHVFTVFSLGSKNTVKKQTEWKQ